MVRHDNRCGSSATNSNPFGMVKELKIHINDLIFSDFNIGV